MSGINSKIDAVISNKKIINKTELVLVLFLFCFISFLEKKPDCERGSRIELEYNPFWIAPLAYIIIMDIDVKTIPVISTHLGKFEYFHEKIFIFELNTEKPQKNIVNKVNVVEIANINDNEIPLPIFLSGFCILFPVVTNISKPHKA
ncbi:hypothetical protein FACS189459_2800 [Bacilli bacterium]|nr:hypothetical protein FACS189459_2800 [Bacilli bacterium]GHU51746.1 hypothetical protein FACS189496_0630 [Bacilli bacterium]